MAHLLPVVVRHGYRQIGVDNHSHRAVDALMHRLYTVQNGIYQIYPAEGLLCLFLNHQALLLVFQMLFLHLFLVVEIHV